MWTLPKAKAIGLTDVDRKLLRMQKKAQEVIITAAIRSNYPIVKILHSDGYKIFDKMADDRFFFSEDAEYFDTVDMMERHIGGYFFKNTQKYFIQSMYECTYILAYF